MPDPTTLPPPGSELAAAQADAAQARLERDLVLALAQAEVTDPEVCLILVQRQLAVEGVEATAALADRPRLAAVVRAVLDQRPYLRKASSAAGAAPTRRDLPGPLPATPPGGRPIPPDRAAAWQRARASRCPADLADYLRLRRARDRP